MSEIVRLQDVEREPWERLDGESAQAFAAFVLFRDIPPSRRMIVTAADVYHDENPRRGSRSRETTRSQFRQWATAYQWRNRVDLYDLHIDRQRRAEREDRRREMDSIHADAGRTISLLGAQRIVGDDDVLPVDPNDLPPLDAVRFIQAGRELEAGALGVSAGLNGALSISMADLNRIATAIVSAALESFQAAPEVGLAKAEERFLLAVKEIGETSVR